MGSVTALLTRLLYGTGMRLRVKDADFDRHVIVVRDAKGGTASPLHALEALA